LEERRLDAAIADRPSFHRAIRQAQTDRNRPVAVEGSSNDPKELYWLAGLYSGSHVWGFLFWRGLQPPLPDETAHVIQMAGVALTMAYYSQYEQALRQRPSFLEAFFAGHYSSTEAAVEYARLEGCDILKMNRLLIVEPSVKIRSISELRTIAEGAVIGLNYVFYAGIYSGSIIVLLEYDADEKAAAEAVFERMKSSETSVLIGVSRMFRDIGDLRDAYDETRKSLALFRKRGEKNAIVHYDALGVYRLLLTTERAELEDMMDKAIGPLLRLEKKQSEELLSTLLHYIRTGGSIQQAAEQCYVHLNTVKYRLKRISQLLHADLSLPDERFKLDFALRAMEILDL
jgi:sugar diacid utilization regulator